MTALLLANAATALALTGLAWFVQVVHYPLFAEVPAGGFRGYEREHVRRTTWVVAPLMLVEAAAALLLAVIAPGLLTVLGLALLVVVWASTFLLQVPAHARLAHGFDAAAHTRLVATSWLRTAAWTGRAAVALALLA